MTTLLRIGALALLLVLLAACAEDADEAEPLAEPEAGEETTPPDEDPDDEAADADAVEVATAATDLGEVLVDGEDMTLYMFEPDEAAASTCYDDCAESWPPLVVDGEPAAGDGVDADLLGTTERDDGSLQATYDGWPLYYWAGDEAPGDAEGQGVNEVWWVLAADGTPVRDGEADDGEGDDGGYGY